MFIFLKLTSKDRGQDKIVTGGWYLLFSFSFQGRLFSYHDTHLHRLGTNYSQLPVNCPYRTKGAGVKNYQRDGFMNFDNQGDAPNYFPNSFNGPVDDRKHKWSKCSVSGDVERFETGDEDNYSQVCVCMRAHTCVWGVYR